MRARPGWHLGLLALLLLAAVPGGQAAPASAEMRLAAPLDLSGEVSLGAPSGMLVLPDATALPGRASRLNITLVRVADGHDPGAHRGGPPATDPVSGLVLGAAEPARRLARPAAPAEVRYLEMLEPDRITFTSWQLHARRILAVGPYDQGELALDASTARVREAAAGAAGPVPRTFAADPDAAWLLAEAPGQGRATGSVRGLFEGVTLVVQNRTASLQVDTVDRGGGARWQALFRWTDAELAPRGALALLAPRMGLDLDGTAASPGAWGRVAVDGEAQRAAGQSLAAQGAMRGTLAPGGGAVALRGQGDLAALTLGGARQDFAPAVAVAGSAALLALAWRFLAVPLYARIAPNELLDNDVRRRVHAHVTEHAGADVKGTAAAVGVSWSTAAYHLARLEREGVLTSRRAGRSKRFFLNGGTVTVRAEAIGALRNPTAFAIAELVAQHPGLMQKEIGAALRLPASTVSWHMRRLRDLGVVREARRWRRAEYAPGPLWQELERTLREDATRAAGAAAAEARGPPPAGSGGPSGPAPEPAPGPAGGARGDTMNPATPA